MKISECVFVFGSNESGIMGKGAALTAKQLFGATSGQGIGRSGMSYAIPTKSTPYKTLPLDSIKKYIDEFLVIARKNSQITYLVTAVGTGLAGYSDVEMRNLFIGAPSNCIMPLKWRMWRTPYHKWENITAADMDRDVLEPLEVIPEGYFGVW